MRGMSGINQLLVMTRRTDNDDDVIDLDDEDHDEED